ncbi:hypothetical protein DFJ77DRAFT_304663 [Powellomyces hirtus]|nr:hypothetical protein DFJ77DRAFT_304663 [Powellomyces hirtus]
MQGGRSSAEKLFKGPKTALFPLLLILLRLHNLPAHFPPHILLQLDTMKLLAFFMVLFCMMQTAFALKCACKGGQANSRRACNAIGAFYSVNSCGFTGCCVNAGDQRKAFEGACKSLGFNFKRCDSCATCN